MCGVAGVIDRDGRVPAGVVAALHAALGHRGPDDRGWMCWRRDGGVVTGIAGEAAEGATLTLVHTRLSIIDLTHAGHQPMATADGRYWISFNGEIVNYVELRGELERDGAVFSSSSDTEVLLAAWQRWGQQCLNRLVGMFAFALFDSERREVVLVRDFFGIKPMVWAATPRGFAFGSELPAVLATGLVPARVDPQRLYDYVRWGLTDHDDATMVAGVRNVPAGHLLRLPLDSSLIPEPEPYWQPPERRNLEITLDEAADELRALFVDSVRMHLRSDVAVGTALSGGLDSSAIAAVARELAPNVDFHSFSYIAGDARYDEERWVDLVARDTRATTHKVRADPGDLVHDLDELVRSQGEPFVSTSMFAQRLVFAAARQHAVPVLLDGQGADELFGGYRSYFAGRMVSLLKRGHVGDALRLSRAMMRNPDVHIGASAVRRMAAGLAPPRARRRTARLLHRDPFPAWLDASWFLARGVDPRDVTSEGAQAGFDGQLLAAFTRTSLPALLRYEDRNSMAFSIESRVPFLTPAIVDFVFRLPTDLLFDKDGTTKLVFREAMRGIVPDAVIDRRDKVGFNTPELSWYQSLASTIDSALAAGDRPVAGLRLDACRERWARIRDGREDFDWVVWRWLNLQRWTEVFDVEG